MHLYTAKKIKEIYLHMSKYTAEVLTGVLVFLHHH